MVSGFVPSLFLINQTILFIQLVVKSVLRKQFPSADSVLLLFDHILIAIVALLAISLITIITTLSTPVATLIHVLIAVVAAIAISLLQ